MADLDRLLKRTDLNPATRAWLEARYGVKTQEPGEWVQPITLVYDGVDKLVLEGDRRVLVNEPASGQKLEIGYFKDKTTVGELRHKLRVLLEYRCRAKFASGCGFETSDAEWTRGPLLCGGILLSDDDRTLTSYEAKGGLQGEPSVIFSVGSVGEVLEAAVDPDLGLEAVKQLKEMADIRKGMGFFRHKNRGPGGVSGN